jgi:uncharacterized protein with FMN-binding domain
MRRIVLWVLSTVSALALLFGYSTSTSGPQANRPATSVWSSSSSTSPEAGSAATGSPGSGSSSSTSKSSGTRTVTGAVAQTRWGPVQLQLQVTKGRISKVSVLQYPDGNGKDAEINGYALPILIRETQDSQSADIDMVSGATVTSDGYLQSLQSALDQAGL